MSANPPPAKQVPMYWVVLAIVLFIAVYTFLRLHYAKRARPFEPYHDMGEEVTVDRLLKYGFQQIPVTLRRPTAPLPAARLAPPAAIGHAAGGLPPELERLLVFKPALPRRIAHVAARAVAAGADYEIQFDSSEPDLTKEIHRVLLYRRGRQLFLLPDYRPLYDGHRAAAATILVVAGFPLHRLVPGDYALTLCARDGSRHWRFAVP